MVNYEKRAARYDDAKERLNASLETLRASNERVESLSNNLYGFVNEVHGGTFGSGADREKWRGELPDAVQERDAVAKKMLGDMFVLVGKHPVVAKLQAKLYNGESFDEVKDTLWRRYRVSMFDDSQIQ